MLVDHVLDSGIEKVQTKKKKIQLYTLSTGIFQNVQMVTQIRMLL